MEQVAEIKEEPLWLGEEAASGEPSAVKSEVPSHTGDAEPRGLAQLSQSSYSADINMGHEASVKQEQADFGFVDVSLNNCQAVPSECAKSPDKDPLEMPDCPASHIKHEIFYDKGPGMLVRVKQEPPDPETFIDVDQPSCAAGLLQSDQDVLPSSAFSNFADSPIIGMRLDEGDIKQERESVFPCAGCSLEFSKTIYLECHELFCRSLKELNKTNEKRTSIGQGGWQQEKVISEAYEWSGDSLGSFKKKEKKKNSKWAR